MMPPVSTRAGRAAVVRRDRVRGDLGRGAVVAWRGCPRDPGGRRVAGRGRTGSGWRGRAQGGGSDRWADRSGSRGRADRHRRGSDRGCQGEYRGGRSRDPGAGRKGVVRPGSGTADCRCACRGGRPDSDARGPARGDQAGGPAGGPARGQAGGKVRGHAGGPAGGSARGQTGCPAGGPAGGPARGQAGGKARGHAGGPAGGSARGQAGGKARGHAGGPAGGSARGQAPRPARGGGAVAQGSGGRHDGSVDCVQDAGCDAGGAGAQGSQPCGCGHGCPFCVFPIARPFAGGRWPEGGCELAGVLPAAARIRRAPGHAIPGTEGYRMGSRWGKRWPCGHGAGAPLAGGAPPRMGITLCNAPAVPLASLFTPVMTLITYRT